MRTGWVLAALLATLAAGCGFTVPEDAQEGSGTVVEEVVTDEAGGTEVIVVDRTPKTPKVPIDAVLPDDGWQLHTFGSTAGPCVESTDPGGARQTYCSYGSGLDHPDTGVRLNGPLWRTPDRMVHLGLAHAQIVRVAIAQDGQIVRETPTYPVTGSSHRGFLIWGPTDVDQYGLLGLDIEGCARHDEVIDLVGDDQIFPGSRETDCG